MRQIDLRNFSGSLIARWPVHLHLGHIDFNGGAVILAYGKFEIYNLKL
jgi:hypothetical protein